MKTSLLQKARAQYQPKLPKGLQGAVKVKEGEPTQSVGNQKEIKELFPNTYGMPLIEFVPGDKEATNEMNVGIILSGGQAPGGHNVICGIYDAVKKMNKNNKVYGFLMGPGGLVDHNYVELTEDFVDQYRNTGGFDMIGSGRTKLEKVDQFEKGLEIIRELNIKAVDAHDLILSLSGGNQQKVFFARWLNTEAEILLLDNPTQGIDVGAKAEIYKLILKLAEEGKTVLVNSQEIPELQRVADRCAVFYSGRIVKILSHEEITEHTVMLYATNAIELEEANAT